MAFGKCLHINGSKLSSYMLLSYIPLKYPCLMLLVGYLIFRQKIYTLLQGHNTDMAGRFYTAVQIVETPRLIINEKQVFALQNLSQELLNCILSSLSYGYMWLWTSERTRSAAVFQKELKYRYWKLNISGSLCLTVMFVFPHQR